jgi:hypothetical protein
VSALALLLTAGAAGCSHPLAPDTVASADAVSVYEVEDGRVGCCALLDLGAAGHLGVGRVDYRDGRMRAWSARIGGTGQPQWDRQLALPIDQTAFSAAAITGAGDLYVVGWSAGLRRPQQILVTRLQRDGEPQWIRMVGIRERTTAEAAIITRDDSLVIAGFTRDSRPAGTVFIAGVSRSGDIAWHWPVADANELPPWVRLIESATGGFVVAGMFGVTHMETDGRRRWEHTGIDVMSALEDSAGDVLVMGAIADGRGGSHEEVQKLSGRSGAVLWTRALAGICTVTGSWASPRGGVIVAGNPCDTIGELWLTEVSTDGRAMGVTRLKLPRDAQAYRAASTRDGHVIAAGGFAQETEDGKDHPDGLKGWIMKTARPVRYTK